MKNNDKGFTLVELLIGLSTLFTLVAIVGIGFVGFHFITKFW